MHYLPGLKPPLSSSVPPSVALPPLLARPRPPPARLHHPLHQIRRHHQVRASLFLSPRQRCLALRPPRPPLSPAPSGRRGARAQPLVRPHGEGQRELLAQPAAPPRAPRPAAAAAPASARACLNVSCPGRRAPGIQDLTFDHFCFIGGSHRALCCQGGVASLD